MSRKLLTTALLALTLSTSACIGPMNASGRLKTWNREIENRWVGEAAYIGLRIPWGGVYGLFFLSDVLVFNSIEFWGGQNPVEPVDPERIRALRELDQSRHGPRRE